MPLYNLKEAADLGHSRAAWRGWIAAGKARPLTSGGAPLIWLSEGAAGSRPLAAGTGAALRAAAPAFRQLREQVARLWDALDALEPTWLSSDEAEPQYADPRRLQAYLARQQTRRDVV